MTDLPNVVRVWRLVLSERAGNTYAGGALVCPEARYVSVLWRGRERLDRRHASPAEWRDAIAQLDTVAEETEVERGTVLFRLFGAESVTVRVRCVERLSIEVMPADLALSLDEVLFDASPTAVPTPPPWVGNPSTREH